MYFHFVILEIVVAFAFLIFTLVWQLVRYRQKIKIIPMIIIIIGVCYFCSLTLFYITRKSFGV